MINRRKLAVGNTAFVVGIVIVLIVGVVGGYFVGQANVPAAPTATVTATQTVSTTTTVTAMPELEKITVIGPPFGGSNIVWKIAEEKGWFKEERLEVELAFGSPQLMAPALISNEAQFSVGTGSVLVAGIKGADVKLVAAVTGPPPFAIHCKPEVKTPKDLEGKQVVDDGPGSAPDTLARLVLTELGVDVDTITWIAIGNHPNALTALQKGSVDCGVFAPPENILAGEAGFPKLLWTGDYVKFWPLVGVTTNGKMIREKPDVVLRFVKVASRAVEWSKAPQNFDEMVSYWMKYYNMDKDMATMIWTYNVQMLSDRGKIDVPEMKPYVDFQRELMGVEQEVTPEDLVDTSFLQRLGIT